MATDDALQALAASERLLIALDFDGTVSPLVDDPARSRALPSAVRAIERLRALPRSWVAFVSGRPLASLLRVTESGPDALLIGSHGVEVQLGDGGAALELEPQERERLARLEAELQPLVAELPGAALEHKPVGFGVHTRLVADKGLVPAFHERVRAAAAAIGGLRERDGKDILEFAVREATKADGIEVLRARLQATAVLYAGDDVTDEDAFAALSAPDLTVKVGQGQTRAAMRVADPEALAQLLEALAERREASLIQH